MKTNPKIVCQQGFWADAPARFLASLYSPFYNECKEMYQSLGMTLQELGAESIKNISNKCLSPKILKGASHQAPFLLVGLSSLWV